MGREQNGRGRKRGGRENIQLDKNSKIIIIKSLKYIAAAQKDKIYTYLLAQGPLSHVR